MSFSAAPHLLHESFLIALLIVVIFAVGCGTAENTNTISNANSGNATANSTPTPTGSPNVTTVNDNMSANVSNTNATGNSNSSHRQRNGDGNSNTPGDDAQNSNAGTAGEIPTRDEIAEQLRKLPWGEIARDIPREMRVGEPSPVRVYIARGITNNPSSGVPQVAQVSKVKLAPVMGAFLISADGNAFDIARVYPKDKDVQGVGGDQTTEWIWSVTPLKSGNYKLEVRATVELVIPGHENQLVTQTVFSEGVTVKVNPFYSAKKILKDYWYIITALVLTPLGWYINKRWSTPK